jgi:hypothetical protein
MWFVLMWTTGGIAVMAWAEPTVSIKIDPEQKTILPGEPCVLSVTFSNLTSSEIILDLGTDGTAAFSFKLGDDKSRQAAQGAKLPKGGLSRSGKRILSANGEIRERVILNQWISTFLKPGTYTVTCYVEAPGMPQMAAETSIEVLVGDDQRLKDIFSALAKTVWNGRGYEERFFAARMLAFSNSRLVVPYLEDIIRAENLSLDLKILAIEGIEREGTLDAAIVKPVVIN